MLDHSRKCRNLWNSLVIASLIAGSLYQAASAAEAKFAWPVPSRATVTETLLKKGKAGKMRYNIVLTRQKAGKNLELRFENCQLIEMNGIDLTTEENRQKVGPRLDKLSALASVMPTLIISPDGSLVDVTGMEESIENALTVLNIQDPERRAELNKIMKSPEVVAQSKEKAAEFWKIWVDTWIGCNPAPGQTAAFEIEIPLENGGAVRTPLIVRSDAGGAPGQVRFSAQTTLAGQPALKAMGATVKRLMEMSPPAKGEKPFSMSMIKSLKRTIKYSVVTNPKTLQPLKSDWETDIDMTINNEKTSSVEKHSYIFSWAAPNAR